MTRPATILLVALGLPALVILAIWLASGHHPADSPPVSRPPADVQVSPGAQPTRSPAPLRLPDDRTSTRQASSREARSAEARLPQDVEPAATTGRPASSTSSAAPGTVQTPAAPAPFKPEVAGHEQRTSPPSELDEQVMEFVRIKQLGPMDDDSRRAWRDRLVEGARAAPEDPAADDALFEAATLSGWLGEDAAQEELLRACVQHPRVEPTTRILALRQLTTFTRTRDVAEAFANLNEIARLIRAMDPSLRESWTVELHNILWRKGELLSVAQGTRKPIGALPPEDVGKHASDYYQEYLDLPPEERARPGLPTEASILQALALELEREGQGARAAQVFRELMRRPDRVNPATMLAAWAARAEFPQGGDEYRAALEAAERSLSADDWSHSLSLRIARSYLQDGYGAPYLERFEPLLESDASADREFLDQDPGLRATVLLELAEACQRSDVNDAERAVYYYEKVLRAFPHYGVDFYVYVDLAQLYEGPLADRRRAIEYYERFLIEAPTHPSAENVASQLKRVCETEAGSDRTPDK